MRPRLRRRGNGGAWHGVVRGDQRFNEAAPSQARKTARYSGHGQSWMHRFNEAAPSQARKLRPRLGLQRSLPASMRPRLRRRGNLADGDSQRYPRQHASMRPRLRRRGNRGGGERTQSAPLASMRPRLRRRGNTSPLARRPAQARASMRPRLRRRGNAGPIPGSGVRAEGFNEAAPSQARKP